MYMVFLSESGLTGASANDPNQPHHIHAGLLVQENQYISMCGEYDALVRRHFGSPPGADGVPAELNPGTFTRAPAPSAPGGRISAPS